MAISRDSGSLFPVIAQNAGTQTTITSGTFSTSGATLLVVTIASNNFNGSYSYAGTLAWVGGAPAGVSAFIEQVAGEYVLAGSNSQAGVRIWTAVSSQAISSKQLIFTFWEQLINSQNLLVVEALLGTNGVGGSAQVDDGNVGNVTPQGTINGVSGGSWLIGAATSEAGALGPVTDWPEVIEYNNGTNYAAYGVKTDGVSGNIPVGWSTPATQLYQSFAALEIKAYTSFGLNAGFPKTASQGAGDTSGSIATASFSTTGPSLMVAIVGVGSSSSNAVPLSIAGGGLTWTSEIDVPLTGTYSNWGGVRIWTATSPGALSNVTVTATFSNTGGKAATLAVYSYTGGKVGNKVGATGTPDSDTARSGNIAINATADSALLAVTLNGSTGAGLTAYTTGITVATDVSATDTVGGNTTSVLSVRSISTLATQSYNIGATSNDLYTCVAAIEIKAASAVTVAEGPWGAPISSVLTNTTPTFSTSASGVLLAFVNADGSSGNTCTGVSGAGLTWAKCGGGAPPDDTTSLSEIWWAYASTTLSNVTVTADVSTSSNFGLTIVRLDGAHPIAPVGKTLGPLIHGRGTNNYYLEFTGLNVGSMLFGAGFPENYIGPGAATGTTIIDAQNGVAMAYRSTAPVAATTESIGLSYGSDPAKGSRFGVEIKPDEPVLISSFPASTTAQGAALTGTTTFASSTFSTTGLKTIVVTAAYNSFDTGTSEITLTWTGGTPANATGFTKIARAPTRYLQSGVWIATTTGDLTTVGVTITQTGTAGTADSALISVYVFDTDKGAAGFGTPFIYLSDAEVAMPYAATLNTTPGSYVLAVTCTGGEQGFVNNPIAGQTAVASIQAPGSDWCAAAYRRATGTSTSIGWGSGVNVSIWQAFIAVEYRGDLVTGFPLSGFRM